MSVLETAEATLDAAPDVRDGVDRETIETVQAMGG